jgi:hypothetical protein
MLSQMLCMLVSLKIMSGCNAQPDNLAAMARRVSLQLTRRGSCPVLLHSRTHLHSLPGCLSCALYARTARQSPCCGLGLRQQTSQSLVLHLSHPLHGACC